MPCYRYPSRDGHTIFVCQRGSRGRRIADCDSPRCSFVHTTLCDWPLRGSKAGQTCDRKLCDLHAHEVAPDQHLCPAHRTMWERLGKPRLEDVQ